MSETVVKEIIQRAVEDETFRNQLFQTPQAALTGYELTTEEAALLQGLNKDNFDEFAGSLGGRTTKGRWIPGGG